MLAERKERDARIGGGEALHDVPGSVGRAVVDDDHLEVDESLIENALDRLLEVRLAVVYRDDGAHARHLSRAVPGVRVGHRLPRVSSAAHREYRTRNRIA